MNIKNVYSQPQNDPTFKNCLKSKMENFISPLRFKKSNYVIRLFPINSRAMSVSKIIAQIFSFSTYTTMVFFRLHFMKGYLAFWVSTADFQRGQSRRILANTNSNNLSFKRVFNSFSNSSRLGCSSPTNAADDAVPDEEVVASCGTGRGPMRIEDPPSLKTTKVCDPLWITTDWLTLGHLGEGLWC